MSTKTGHLVLADISGYTAFVAETELEHSREILNELLEGIVSCLAKHLAIGQIEGDAIFALGEGIPADPLAWLQDCYFGFHRHIAQIKRVTTCPCKACANVGILTLKFICHYGEYLPQTFMGKETFVGNAVNMAHRLLKNKVPSHEYVLVTNEALERFPAALRSSFTAHREQYDLGGIDCGWMDLAPLRDDPRAKEEIKAVDERRADLRYDDVIRAPKDLVWTVLTDPALRQKWMGVQRIDYRPGARHTLVGAEYHCIHGQGQSTIFRVAEALEPDRLTMAVPLPQGVIGWQTTQLQEADGGTRMISRWRLDAPAGVGGKIAGFISKRILKGYADRYTATMTRDAEALAQRAPAPSTS
jgi:uncharacterized protein YndB with AHSA1/START domain/class 3 adenylate cyclase